MRGEIKKLHQRVGKTTVYVTHDQVEAMTLSSRIAVMHKGELQQFDEPQAIYDRPANMFVAGFMGSPAMNFLPARLGSDGITLASGTRLGFARNATAGAAGGHDVVVGIRPEHFRRATAGEADTISATTSIVEPTGSETHVVFHHGAHDVTATFAPREAPAVGETVSLAFDASRACLFDAATERAL